MARLSFGVGQLLVVNGAEFEMDRKLPSGIWQLKNVATGEYSKRSEFELYDLYSKDELSLVVTPDNNCEATRKIGRVLAPDLSYFGEKAAAMAERYTEYMKAIDEADLNALSDKELQPIIDGVAPKIDDKKPPSPKTLRRARKKWLAGARDSHSQLPNYAKRGHRNRFSAALEWLIALSISVTVLTKLKKKVIAAFNDFTAKLDAINAQDQQAIEKLFDKKVVNAPELKQLTLQVQQSGPIISPEKWVFYRRMQQISDYDRKAAQIGLQAANKEYRIVYPGERTSRPGERVDSDETKTDLFCVDDIRCLWLGRTHGVVLFDAFCDGVKGGYLGFEPQSLLSYMNAIRHSILPKAYIRTEYPGIKNDWPLHGLDDLYNLDNTMAVHSGHFEKIAKRLNTIIIFDPPRMPWFKGLVERFFRELNESLLHQQLGTTFSHFEELDPEFDPKKNAVIPYGLLQLMWHKFVCDIHLQSPIRGKNESPAQRWSNYVDAVPPPLPPRASELDIILGRTFEKPIWHYGIELGGGGLKYQSRELGELWRRLSRPGRRHPKVEVISPPGDLGYIHVLDPETKQYFRVPEVHPEYSNGLALWAHKVHCAYCRKRYKRNYKIHDLAAAQAEIWQWCLGAAKLNSTVARYMENHAKNNPAGMLAAADLVRRTIDQMAGKKDQQEELPETRPNKRLPAGFNDPASDQLPDFASSRDLPELSSSKYQKTTSQEERSA